MDRSSATGVDGVWDDSAQSGSAGKSAGMGGSVSFAEGYAGQSCVSGTRPRSGGEEFDRKVSPSSSAKAELPDLGGVVATGETDRVRDSGVIGKCPNGGLPA